MKHINALYIYSFIFLLLFLIATPCLAQPITLVTLGDSLTVGDGDEEGASLGGFPPRLLTKLQQDYPDSTLNNVAVSGFTSNDLINVELTPAIQVLNSAPTDNLKIALVWIGSNDLFGLYNNVCDEYYPGDYDRCEQDELNSFQNNLNKIITDLSATGAEVYIALLDDQSKRPIMANASLRSDTFSNISTAEVARMSSQVVSYNNTIATLASTLGATTVDFYQTTIFTDAATLSSDGNHPNSAGYDAITTLWYAAITGSTSTPITKSNPQVDIKADHSDQQITVNQNSQVSLSLSLNSGSYTDTAADWWILAVTPSGKLLSYIHPDQWVTTAATVNDVIPAYQGALFDFPETILTRYTLTETGMYHIYFGVDRTMNHILDVDSLDFDQVSIQVNASSAVTTGSGIFSAEDFHYMGAFRLPDDGNRPFTFEYGGDAVTYNPQGDSTGAGDAYSGSLFVMGHERLAYGELPNGNQVAEVSIPAPVISKNLNDLNQATFIQPFSDIAKGYFSSLAELPTAGMQYLSTPATGAKIHLCWGQHEQQSSETMIASHAWFDLTLSKPNLQGTWFIGNHLSHDTNAYLMDIPTDWADEHLAGRYLATGRFRDGGWSGQGPSLFAYRPWIDENGTPAASGSHLEEKILLQYASSNDVDNVVEKSLNNYQHPDEWEGAAWISAADKSSLLFAGTKGTGDKYWYGYLNTEGTDSPCVSSTFVGQFTVCRMADGSTCPAQDLINCTTRMTHRGWWSSRFNAQFILYSVSDMEKVATGEMQPWEPQPYLSIDIDEHLLLNSDGIDDIMLGVGMQRRYRIGNISFDRVNNRLYVLELYADGAKPVVHVWKIYG